MDVGRYLERIGFDREPRVDRDTLFGLHRAHLRTIPYENIDVQLQRQVDLDIERIFDKIVEQRRGGWCYEMNGIFSWALAEIGFPVIRMGGAVGREFNGRDDFFGAHLILDVEADGERWLCDVGFGDAVIEPIPFEVGHYEQRGYRFELLRDGEYWRLRNHQHGGAPSFDFAKEPIDEGLLQATCDWLRTDEKSPFVRWLVVQTFTADGYAQQQGLTARTITPEGKQEHKVTSADELVDRLESVFGLDVPEVADLWDQLVERHEQHLAEQEAS